MLKTSGEGKRKPNKEARVNRSFERTGLFCPLKDRNPSPDTLANLYKEATMLTPLQRDILKVANESKDLKAKAQAYKTLALVEFTERLNRYKDN